MQRHLTMIKGLIVLVLALTFAVGVVQAQQTCAPNSLYPRTSPAPFFNGLAAWWPAGGLANSSCLQAGCFGFRDIIGGNNGTPFGGASFANGKVGQAFSFDGATGYVDIQNPHGLTITGPITVAAWVNPNVLVTSPGQAIFSEMSSNYNLGEVELRIDPAGDFIWFRRPTSGSQSVEYVNTSILAVAGAWQHVVGVYDGSNYQLYVNGVLEAATPQSGQSLGAGPDPLIGTDSQFVEWFNGLIDEVQVFSRALSVSEIQAIYSAGSHGVCPQAHFGNPTAIPPVPTLMGVSIGNTPSLPGLIAGTAGLLVHSMSYPTVKYILSNNHVLGAMGPTNCPNTARKGARTLQPGTFDIGRDPGPFDPTYHVADFSLYWPLGPDNNEIDAAISIITDPTKATSEIFGIGQPNPASGMARNGEGVIKTGRTTAFTVGFVKDINFAVSIGSARCGYKGFVHQIVISSPTPFAIAGDSGAAILDSVTKTPVGLLFGADNSLCSAHTCFAYANPISTVYKDLNVFPDSPSGAGPRSAEDLKAMEDSARQALDPRLVRLEEIQDRHQDEVLRIPGVQGIGIGLDDNGQDLVFHVHVIKQTAALAAAVPREIEGVPVRFVETGGELKFL